jgi:aspartyl aminopeptidase
MEKDSGKKENPAVQELEKKLKWSGKLAWDRLDDRERGEAFRFAEGYKHFLDRAKTEREAVREILELARESGFREPAEKAAGKKFLFENKGRSAALAVLGASPLAGGAKLIVSHIDSPRIDLKQNPLYEEADMALLRTHYYGGIKKY